MVFLLVMNPPIQSMPYQQSTTPAYPLKPQEVPMMPTSYTDGHGSSAGYPPATGYPPVALANNPGGCIASLSEVVFLSCVVYVLVVLSFKRIIEKIVNDSA